MYKLVSENEGIRFQFKEEDDNILNRMKEQTSNYNNSILKFPLENMIVEDYFNTETDAAMPLDSAEKLKKSLRFFYLHEFYDAVTLNEDLVNDFEFLKIFDIFANAKSFSSPCL
jgi:hypothetical protein